MQEFTKVVYVVFERLLKVIVEISEIIIMLMKIYTVKRNITF